MSVLHTGEVSIPAALARYAPVLLPCVSTANGHVALPKLVTCHGRQWSSELVRKLGLTLRAQSLAIPSSSVHRRQQVKSTGACGHACDLSHMSISALCVRLQIVLLAVYTFIVLVLQCCPYITTQQGYVSRRA